MATAATAAPPLATAPTSIGGSLPAAARRVYDALKFTLVGVPNELLAIVASYHKEQVVGWMDGVEFTFTAYSLDDGTSVSHAGVLRDNTSPYAPYFGVYTGDGARVFVRSGDQNTQLGAYTCLAPVDPSVSACAYRVAAQVWCDPTVSRPMWHAQPTAMCVLPGKRMLMSVCVDNGMAQPYGELRVVDYENAKKEEEAKMFDTRTVVRTRCPRDITMSHSPNRIITHLLPFPNHPHMILYAAMDRTRSTFGVFDAKLQKDVLTYAQANAVTAWERAGRAVEDVYAAAAEDEIDLTTDLSVDPSLLSARVRCMQWAQHPDGRLALLYYTEAGEVNEIYSAAASSRLNGPNNSGNNKAVDVADWWFSAMSLQLTTVGAVACVWANLHRDADRDGGGLQLLYSSKSTKGTTFARERWRGSGGAARAILKRVENRPQRDDTIHSIACRFSPRIERSPIEAHVPANKTSLSCEPPVPAVASASLAATAASVIASITTGRGGIEIISILPLSEHRLLVASVTGEHEQTNVPTTQSQTRIRLWDLSAPIKGRYPARDLAISKPGATRPQFVQLFEL